MTHFEIILLVVAVAAVFAVVIMHTAKGQAEVAAIKSHVTAEIATIKPEVTAEIANVKQHVSDELAKLAAKAPVPPAG